MTAHRSFVAGDGCTLKPVPPELLNDMNSMRDVLLDIQRELKRHKTQYEECSYEDLMSTLWDATDNDAGVLSEKDLRAILSFNVQWVNL